MHILNIDKKMQSGLPLDNSDTSEEKKFSNWRCSKCWLLLHWDHMISAPRPSRISVCNIEKLGREYTGVH